jgi:hypothetical protein
MKMQSLQRDGKNETGNYHAKSSILKMLTKTGLSTNYFNLSRAFPGDYLGNLVHTITKSITYM